MINASRTGSASSLVPRANFSSSCKIVEPRSIHWLNYRDESFLSSYWSPPVRALCANLHSHLPLVSLLTLLSFSPALNSNPYVSQATALQFQTRSHFDPFHLQQSTLSVKLQEALSSGVSFISIRLSLRWIGTGVKRLGHMFLIWFVSGLIEHHQHRQNN